MLEIYNCLFPPLPSPTLHYNRFHPQFTHPIFLTSKRLVSKRPSRNALSTGFRPWTSLLLSLPKAGYWRSTWHLGETQFHPQVSFIDSGKLCTSRSWAYLWIWPNVGCGNHAAFANRNLPWVLFYNLRSCSLKTAIEKKHDQFLMLKIGSFTALHLQNRRARL